MKSFLNKIQIDKNIVVLGALNMDLNIHTNRVPEVGETFEGDSFYTNPGGKAGNQAVSAIRSSKSDKEIFEFDNNLEIILEKLICQLCKFLNVKIDHLFQSVHL